MLAGSATAACDDGTALGPESTAPAEAEAALITYTGVVSGPTGWTTAGSVTASGTGGCCGNYTDASGGVYPIMFRMAPTTTTATATTTISGLTAQTAYTVAVKMRGNHAAIPPTLAVIGSGVQIVKAYSYMDAADENQWREHSFVVYTATGSTSFSLQLSCYMNSISATCEFALPRVYAGYPAVPVPEVGQAAFVATPARTNAPTTGQNLLGDSAFALGTGTPWLVDNGAAAGGVLTLTPTAADARAQQTLTMWLAPSTSYTLTYRGGVASGNATVYAVTVPANSSVASTLVFTSNLTSTVTGTPTTPASLPPQTRTFTTGSGYSRLRIYFEKYRGTSRAYFAVPTLNAVGTEWTDTPWAVPPRTTAVLDDSFTGGTIDPQKWLIPDKAWGGDNGGVYHTNVRRAGGTGVNGIILEAHGNTYPIPTVSTDPHYNDPSSSVGRARRVGAAIVTKNYYASATYDVWASVPNNLGACTAFWPFHYMGLSTGDAAYWAEPSPIRNTEIDWEMPTDYVDASTGVRSNISFMYQRENNWGGQWGGEGGESSLRHIGTSTIADGSVHKFTIEWKSGTDTGTTRTAGTIKWFIDDVLVQTFTGTTYGQDNVPFRAARFWVGIWFPAAGYTRTVGGSTVTDTGWAGTPNFNTAQLKIQRVRITPITTQGRDVWVSETAPSGYYASPDLYP